MSFPLSHRSIAVLPVDVAFKFYMASVKCNLIDVQKYKKYFSSAFTVG